MTTHIKHSIYLSYHIISYHLIQGNKQTRYHKGRNIGMARSKETCDRYPYVSFNQAWSYPSPKHKINACLTSLTLLHLITYALMHGHLNTCLWQNKEIIEEKP